HGQNAGEKAARVALLGSQRTTGAGQREANFELTGQRETHEEQEAGHERQKDRRLELESPAQRGARRAEAQKHTHQYPERNYDACGVDETMSAQFVTFFVAGVDQRT